MQKVIVVGNNILNGTVEIEGAKNAALPIMAASILMSNDEIKFTNIPPLSDILLMEKLLNALNVKTDYDKANKTMIIKTDEKLNAETPQNLVDKMRASVVVLGPLLAKNGYAKVAMPGGCAIGSRPVDLHIKGLRKLGAEINQKNGYIEAKADRLIGSNIYLDFPSVGATQNIMMAATLAEGTTVIENVAQEPEIVDLANVLNKMGAKIYGAGTDTLKIKGVEKLTGCEHSIVQDRIEAGTYMIAAAITNGNVLIKDAIYEHNLPLIAKLQEMGVEIERENTGVRVKGPSSLKPVEVKTLPHPGFPTDMQAQMSIAQILSTGVSTITETVFENRFMHLHELEKMNADFKIKGNTAILMGNSHLVGAEVAATDLRAAAALVLAGLVANGKTIVTNLNYMDRGYYGIVTKLKALGANIRRVNIDSKGRETLVDDEAFSQIEENFA